MFNFNISIAKNKKILNEYKGLILPNAKTTQWNQFEL